MKYVVGRRFDGDEIAKWLNWLSIIALSVATCAVVYAIGSEIVPKWVIGFALSGGVFHLIFEYFIRLIE